MVQAVTQVSGTAVPLLLDDIDTDRIIPARFLRCVTFDGLGAHAFEDDRQQDRAHPFDNPVYQGACVLIAGRNFGCGSSREHAPQALIRWGIKAIVAESFAEIFFGNCVSLGVPCVSAARASLEALTAAVQAQPQTTVTIDLLAQTVGVNGQLFPATLPDGARTSLTSGNWDFLGQLLDGAAAVKTRSEAIPYMSGFRA